MGVCQPPVSIHVGRVSATLRPLFMCIYVYTHMKYKSKYKYTYKLMCGEGSIWVLVGRLPNLEIIRKLSDELTSDQTSMDIEMKSRSLYNCFKLCAGTKSIEI